jgi:hypothetical protein
MIKGLTGGAGLVVDGGGSSYPYIPMNNNNPIQGMIRIFGQDLQVFDGSSWMVVGGSYANVSLDSSSRFALDWVKKKMLEEQDMLELAKKSKSVAIALENLNKAKEELELIAILAKEHNEETTS